MNMMIACLVTVCFVIVALFCIFLGSMFSSFRSGRWTLGYFIPLGLIAMLVTVRFSGAVSFVPLLCWLVAGRMKFVILCLAVTMGLTTPLSRLPRRCEKFIICILMVVVVVCFSVLPFLTPALIKSELLNIRTMVNPNGICFQSKDYTCGPAAAVTALRTLGLPAHEGEIAVLSHTNPVTGTLPWCLYRALQNRYGADGLECQYRSFDSIAQLKNAGITLAVVKNVFLLDHCVAVLEVSDWMVTIADPVTGEKLMSHEQFEKIWRFSGIVLKRDVADKT